MPESLASYLVLNAGWGVTTAYTFSYTVFAIASISYANYQRRRTEQRARDAANASAKDREAMIRSAVAPRRVVYGRDRVSGPVVYAQSTGAQKQYLHLVVAFTAHEADAIEDVWFNDIKLPEPDTDGFIMSGEFFPAFKTEIYTHTGTTDSDGILTLPAEALEILSAFTSNGGVGDTYAETRYDDYVFVGSDNFVSNLPPDTEVTVGYTSIVQAAPKVRIRKYLGAPGQVADPDLIAESQGLWTSAHVGNEIPHLYARLEFDQDIFGSVGVPNISVTMRGKKVYDPRAGTTDPSWSNNAALCEADWLKSPEGMRATNEEVPDDELSTAANICDEEVDLHEDGTVAVTSGSDIVVGSGTEWTKYAIKDLLFVGPDDVRYTIFSVIDDTHIQLTSNYGGTTLSGQSYLFKQRRYTCDTSFTTNVSPRDVLAELNECMAGRCVWTQGRWLMTAGAYRTPTLTITADMLVGPVLSIAPKASRTELFNAVRPLHRDPTKDFAEVQAPLVVNAFYQAQDGDVRIVRQIEVPALADTYRAQRMGKIALERARQALTVRINTNLKAYDAAASDNVMLTLPYYGWTSKVFEVIERTFNNEGTLQYLLRETASGIWDWNFGDETINDLAPNTDLPSPYAKPDALTNLQVDQYTQLMGDGTIMTVATLSWDPSEDAFVRNGGRIEVEWAKASDLIINGLRKTGTDVEADISPLVGGLAYIARVRQVNTVGKESDWTYIGFTAIFDETAPEDVTGLDWEIKPGIVRIWCDPCIARDYAETELRYSNTAPDTDIDYWAAATFLVSGKSNEYHHPRPPNGTYYVLAKHKDTSGNYSENPATITVVVDDSIDAGFGGSLTLKSNRFPFFSFADGTTHTAQAPGDADIVFTAVLKNLSGSPTFSAEGFSSGGASIGVITLTGSGLSRTMTASAFVAPGTSGSVRYAVVTATLAGVSDTMTVYRQDSTTTDPRIYLSNPFEMIATDANGENGDYSSASTYVEVYRGLTNDTADWDFSITPDSGVTATINGGAGPVHGNASVLVAVSNMTIPDGAVLITATSSDYADLTASFVLSKNEGGSGYRVYWDPRQEIVLPLGVGGEVSSYDDAYSSLIIETDTGTDDSGNWTFSKEDINVVSTLTANLVQITGVLELGTVGTVTFTDISATLPSGWARGQKILRTTDGWVALGYHGSVTYSKVQTSADFGAWNTVDVGSSAYWSDGAAGNGIVLAVAMSSISTDDVVRSDDDGQTWTLQSRGTTNQAYAVAFLGDRFVISEFGTGARSTVDGISYNSITLPASNCRLWGWTQRWLAESTSGAWYYSANNGGAWTACTGLPAVLTSYGAVVYAGRAIILPNTGVSTSRFYYTDVNENGGNAWTTGSLAQATNGVGFLGIVRGVLYLIGSDGKVQFTTDGKSWRYSGETVTTALNGTACYGMNSLDMDIDFLPGLDNNGTTIYYTIPLDATSETEGFVLVTASKPGEDDITRALPVRRGAVQQGGRTFRAVPFSLALPSTSDGVVTDYSAATVTAYAELNGGDETALWTWSWTATNMTPSSGSTNVATFTAMNSATGTGSVTFTASRAGYGSVSGTVGIVKLKGLEGSGPRIGAGYTVTEAVNTFIGIRFNTDGSVDVKRGSGGSYTRYTQWTGAVVANVGNSYWLYVEPIGGATDQHALSAGTTDTWLALSTARSFEMSDATSGTHTFAANVHIGTSSGGANAVTGTFSMTLLVP